MKRILILAAAVLAAVSCGQKPSQATKSLVLYYSQSANTRAVAQTIQQLTGADIEEIVLSNPYDGTYDETVARFLAEREAGNVSAAVEPLTADLNDYEVIYLGYPIWFGTCAPAIAGLLDAVDLSGKKIVPFCTFGSGGLEASVNDLKEKLVDSEILPGYGVRAARLEAMPQEVEDFLKANGLIEGEYTAPEAFPEAHAVSEEESMLFDAAVGDYPMISARATEVASRAVAGGTEYLFTAVNKPREGMPEMPGAPAMQVYVLAADGQAPVFTRVVR